MSEWLFFALWLPGFLIGLTVHECAHAWAAHRLGDDYPKRMGRISLNPLRHLSLMGTLAIFILKFGWGKPVPLNPYNYRSPRRDLLLVSLAGPASNLLIVAACVLAMFLTRHTYAFDGRHQTAFQTAHLVLMITALINGLLAVINLIPIPPLDGAKIWTCLVPALKPVSTGKKQWLFVALLLVLLYTNALNPLFDRAIRLVDRIMPTTDAERVSHLIHSARLAAASGEPAEAEQYASSALAIYPRSVEALKTRATALSDQRRYAAALADVDEIMTLGTDTDREEWQPIQQWLHEELANPAAGTQPPPITAPTE